MAMPKGMTYEQAQEIIRRLGILIVLLAPKLSGSNTRVDWKQLEALADMERAIGNPPPPTQKVTA